MTAELPSEPIPVNAAPTATAPAKGSRALVLITGGVAVAALASSGLLWQKLNNIQEHLARQSAEAGTLSLEARTLARQAQDLARETAAHQAVTDARVSETSLQRSQLEDLMQSLSRSRDENLVVDIESAVRLAQQQAQLTGSSEPLLAALKSADDRIARAAHPRLAPLQRAIAHDTERIKSASSPDTPGLLVKLDELVRQVDELPAANAVATALSTNNNTRTSDAASAQWWQRWLDVVYQEARKLVRLSRIEQPEAALLSPEQTFFLRENIKLKLLNARLGLLARQMESARADLASASMALNKYFDPNSRKTQAMAGLLQQVQGQMKTAELPQVNETLAALATAAAGH